MGILTLGVGGAAQKTGGLKGKGGLLPAVFCLAHRRVASPLPSRPALEQPTVA